MRTDSKINPDAEGNYAEDQPESGVGRAIDLLDAEIDRISESIIHLVGRLDPILRHPDTAPTQAEGEVRLSHESELARNIDGMAERVKELRRTIAQATGRVDV